MGRVRELPAEGERSGIWISRVDERVGKERYDVLKVEAIDKSREDLAVPVCIEPGLDSGVNTAGGTVVDTAGLKIGFGKFGEPKTGDVVMEGGFARMLDNLDTIGSIALGSGRATERDREAATEIVNPLWTDPLYGAELID